LDWLKTSCGGRGRGRELAENVGIPSYGGGGLKLLKKKPSYGGGGLKLLKKTVI